MKNVLIAGARSYIGTNLKAYLDQWPDAYRTELLATRGLKPSPELFENVDVVFCAAGIAHIKETAENRHLYFEINRDFVVSLAKAAKEAGVRQFILLSSMSVYGLLVGSITKQTEPKPANAYGESKLQADMAIAELEDERFAFICLRPPMVYGKNCKGNYQALRQFALKSPLFPELDNRRSMIYVGNLCEFVKRCIDEERRGLFFPQNDTYSNTSRIVRLIAAEHGRKIHLTKAFNWAIRLFPFDILKKVFGDLTYEMVDPVDRFGFEESIRLTEE